MLQNNLSSFAWSTSDMVGINPNLLHHILNINPSVNPKAQRRRGLSGERVQAAVEGYKNFKK